MACGKRIVLRIVALFGASALSSLAGGAVFNVELWKAASIAGFMSVARVLESLLRAWSEDGSLSSAEVAYAFGKRVSPDEPTDG